MKTLVVCSGGLDSVTLAYKVAAEHELTRILTFDYGQRHKQEIGYAALCAKNLNVPHLVVDIAGVGEMLTGSALTDEIDVPDGHYAEESMRVTVVPNRNAIMLAVSFGVASSNEDRAVATAVHGGDHFIYPDCRPGFIKSFQSMQNHALEGISEIQLLAPFVHRSKADIAAEGGRLGVPFEHTWSCYKGGEVHCGRCGTCVERREAFHIADEKDPTAYEDADFWRQATHVLEEI